MSEAKTIVDTVIEELGGPTKAATKLHLTGPNVILNWRKRNQVPADRCMAIEALTSVSRHDLRPDIFGPAPANAEKLAS